MTESLSPLSRSSQPAIEWRWKAFDDLTTAEVYDMLAARSAVFVVEQNCVYGDVDGLDTDAWHLFAYCDEPVSGGEAGGEAGAEVDAKADAKAGREATGKGRAKLAGYLRVLLPDETETDIRIGRVLTTAEFRGQGLGADMLERALGHITEQWPGTPIRLHAQAHLQPFYGAFGFEPISDVHDDDGIPHVWMRSA